MQGELELRGERGFYPSLLVTVPTAADEVLLLGAGRSTAQLWDPRTGRPVAGPVTLGATNVADMAVVRLAGDRRVLATCGYQEIALWDLGTFGADASPFARYDVHYAWDMSVLPATDGSRDLLVTAEKDLVRVIDPHDGATVSAIRWPASPAGAPGNRVLNPTGVRFGDGTSGFAVANAGRLEVWRLDGGELTVREFGLGQPFRGVMTYLPDADGRSWLAVAVRRGIEMWNLDSGRPGVRGELGIPLDVLAPVRAGGRALVAAAFGRGRESGVLLWDPSTCQPVTGLFNQHGPAWGDPGGSGVSIGAVVAVPYPDGAIRIASAGNDGAVRLSPPVDDLLAEGAGSARRPDASTRRGGGDFALIRDPHGGVAGIWLARTEHVRDDMLIETLLYNEDLTHLMGRPRRIVPNTADDRGGVFVLFDGG